MRVNIRFIPHNLQRYETAGDYWFERDDKDEEVLQIRVSELPDERMMWAIAIHELVEVLICRWLKVDMAAIDHFDEVYEERRPLGNEEEPGDDPRAPYHLQHGFATAAERIYCAAVGLNWKIYTDAVNLLSKPR